MFRWQASPRSIQESLGNTIENNRNIQINSNLRFSNLYNKVDFLEKVKPTSTQSCRARLTAPQRNNGKNEEDPEQDTESMKGVDIAKYLKVAGNTVLR
jgi:cell surface protein SprA